MNVPWNTQAQLQSLIENLNEGLVIADLDGQVLQWNKAALDMHGFDSSESGAQTVAEFTQLFELAEFHGATVAHEQWPLSRILRGEKLTDVQMRVRRNDANWDRILNYSGTIVGEASGRSVALLTMTDVTERTSAEEGCRLLASIVDSSEDAIIGKTLDGVITSWNKGAESLYGYAAAEIVGKPIAVLASHEDASEIATILERVKRGESISHFETVRIAKDGRDIWVSLSVSPIRAPPGVVVGASTIARDITARKHAEQQQQASELRYRRLFESARDGILILNGDSGQIVDVNPYLIELLRYPKEEILGKELWQIGTVENISRAKAVFVELQERDFVRYEDLPLESSEGTVTQVEVVANGYLEGNKRVIQCNIRDITKRKLADDVLKDTNTQLENTLVDLKAKTSELTAMTQQLWQASKLSTMGELTASIAHELNNPLATISLRIEMLANKLAHDEEKSHLLKIIAGEIERMARLIGRLLRFSHHHDQQFLPLNIRDEMESSLELVEYHLRSREIRIRREFDETLPTIQADSGQLRQIFLNVLSNASDAMPQGGTLVARVKSVDSETKDNRGVRIELIDSGPGIAPGDLERIWEPFFTTKPEGKGTGLGLAITRRAIEAHNGTISIGSDSGKGSTVTIFLPAIHALKAESGRLPALQLSGAKSKA